MKIDRRVERVRKVVGQVWGIGKGRFGEDWKRRVWLFDVWCGRFYDMIWK